jgi:uncharacterized protein
MRRVLAVLSLGVLLILLVGLAAGGWYYGDQIITAPPESVPPFEVPVLASDEAAGTLELAVDGGDLADLATVGFVTRDGLVVLEGPVVDTADGIERSGSLAFGEWPAVGDLGGVSVHVFQGDPATTLGYPFDEVEVAGEHGVLPAWRVVPMGARTDGTWVVIAHGRGAGKLEGNRLLPALDELELPSLSIAVRNDDDAAPDPDGFGRYGDTEWRDLAAAIEHLRQVEGARRFVLTGYSQGASLILTYLRRSDEVDDVAAAVLVSPLVSLPETLELQAQNRGIPGPMVRPLLFAASAIVSGRAAFDIQEMDHLDRLEELPAGVPLLVTAGDGDVTIPIGPTRAFAAARPDQVVYEEYPDTDHVREWNADRDRFEAAFRSFLAEHVPAPVG